MQAVEKTKEELVAEVAQLHQRVAELEASERERKKAEEDLKKSEQEKTAIFNSISEHVVLQDTRMRVLWANRAAGESVGVDPQQLVGRHCYEIWQRRSKPCVGCPIVKAHKSGQPQEAEMTTPDGRVWFIRGYPVRDSEGNITGAVEVTLEITERKRAEEELRESEERFRVLFESAPDAICIADPESGKIIDANPAASHLLLRPHEEIVGLHQSKIHPPNMEKSAREGFAKHQQQIRRKQQISPIESVVLRSDGNEVPVEVLAKIVRIKGKDVIQGYFRDTSERKQTEEDLRIKENAITSSINAIAIGELGGGVTYVNPAFLRMWGYNDENEVLGKPGLDFVHEKEKAQEIMEELANGKDGVGELHGKKKDGSLFDVQFLASTVMNEASEPIYMMASFIDITERKQAEEALKKSEEKYRLLSENIPVAVYSALPDENSTTLFLSGRFLELTGYPAEHLLQNPELWTSMIHPEDRDYVWATIQEHRRKKILLEVEYRIITKGNIIKWVRDRATPILGENGEIQRINGFMEDITERKKAQEELRQSEERYRFLFENSQTINILIGTDGKIIDINETAAESLGFKKKSIIGKEVLAFISPDQREEVAEQLALELSGEYTPPLEIDIITKKGTRTLLFTKGHATFFEKGEPKGMLLSAVDITERKQAEDELKIKNNAIQSSITAIAIGEFGGSLTYVNPAFLRMWGYDSETEVIGKSAVDFWHEKEKAQELIEALLKGEDIVGELRGKRKDGSLFDVQLSASIVTNEAGEPIYMMGSFVDITDRKQAERELRESEERFRTICETAQDFISLKDLDLKYTYINPAMERHFGVPASKMFGKTNVSLFGKQNAGFVTQEDLRAISGEIVNEEHSSPIEGSAAIHHVIKVPIRDSSGNITGVCTIGRDITGRKQMEEALRKSEERFRRVVETMKVGMGAIDANGIFTYVNEYFSKILGYSINEMLGSSTFDFFYDEGQRQAQKEALAKRSAGIRDPITYEITWRKKDGQKVYSILSPTPSFDTDGRFTGSFAIITDITERKQAEEKLREREAFNYALFQFNPIETIVVDLEGRVTGFNLAKEQSGGRLPAIGDRMYKDYAGKHESDMREELMKCIKSGDIKAFPERKYGDKYLSITISPFSLGAIIISEDITKRKHAEELLQEERDNFYSILERAPYGVMVLDADGKYSFVNIEFTHITGYTLEDIRPAREWMLRAYPDKLYRNIVKEAWKQDYTQSEDEETFRKKYGRAFSRTFNVICKDGAAKEIEFRTAVMGNEGIIIMLSDITERQRMHDLLETSASEWRTTFDSINDAVCMIDPHGKIVRCNNAMLQVMGKTFSQITNHHCWEVIHGVTEAPNSCPIALMGKTHHRETEVMFKDSRWFNISVDPLLDEDGNLIGGVHIMSDITDRMLIQNELQDSREQLRNLTVYLQSRLEQERTNIAREIHDELAQALTALKMDISWIDHRLPSDAQSLSEKTKSMDKLIDSTIHTVKRISAELRPGVLDDLGLVAAIEWQAEEFQNRTGISCKITVDPPDLTVDQDRSTAIFRIFQETLTNVTRHARASRVSVNLKERGRKLTLRVRDNGTGITEEKINAPQSFGLIGIRERVHPWGGKVSVKGTPGKGTTVTVNIGLETTKHDLEKSELQGSPS